MAEHLNKSPEDVSEQQTATEQAHNTEHHKSLTEQTTDLKAESPDKLAAARQTASEESKQAGETAAPLAEQTASPDAPTFVNRNLKLVARDRLLKQVRSHLPKSQQGFSRIVHQPVVDNISEFSSKTVGRPSGILAGSICALIGSSIFLYIDRHYGYRYNFLLWAIFFAGGFIVGLILEALIKLISRLKS